MSGEALSHRDVLEREKARHLQEAEAKEAAASAHRAAAEAIDRDLAELDRIASKYSFSVIPSGSQTVSHAFDGSILSLIAAYKSHPDSRYRKVRFNTRTYYDNLLRRLERDCALYKVSDLDLQRLEALHRDWARNGATTLAHSLVTMLRGLATFGHVILKDADCRVLRIELHTFKVPVGTKPRTERLTAEHVKAIIRRAHEMGLHSIALAQAFQFDCKLGQKDVVGEWVPISEPGPPSDVIFRDEKWVRGLRWNEIDKDLILRHPASNGGEVIEVNLAECPAVRAELDRLGQPLPQSGPVIVADRRKKMRPWTAYEYRRKWRQIADSAGVPKGVRNNDSRLIGSDDGPDGDVDLRLELEG